MKIHAAAPSGAAGGCAISAEHRSSGAVYADILGGITGAAGGLGDPLVLAMLLETASRAHLR